MPARRRAWEQVRGSPGSDVRETHPKDGARSSDKETPAPTPVAFPRHPDTLVAMSSSSLSRVCVYCASSRQCAPAFFEAAAGLGRQLAEQSVTTIYGGGRAGLMGALADAALAAGGQVVGVIPHFMKELEWGHDEIDELVVVADMHRRKSLMLERSDGVVALPGGSGTLEELMEAITWKRLGLHTKPIVIANLAGFYTPLLEQLGKCIEGRFMDSRHGAMWSAVDSVDEILPALRDAAPWDENARDSAAI